MEAWRGLCFFFFSPPEWVPVEPVSIYSFHDYSKMWKYFPCSVKSWFYKMNLLYTTLQSRNGGFVLWVPSTVKSNRLFFFQFLQTEIINFRYIFSRFQTQQSNRLQNLWKNKCLLGNIVGGFMNRKLIAQKQKNHHIKAASLKKQKRKKKYQLLRKITQQKEMEKAS